MEEQTRWEPTRQAFWLLGLSFLASILLRVPYYQHSLTFVDEGIFGAVAAELARGRVLYSEVWCNNQPLVIYYCKWLFQIFGSYPIVLHLGSLLLVFLESGLLYRIGSRFFSPRVGGMAALAYAIISTNFYTPRIIGFTPEHLMVVFTTGSLYLFLHTLKTNHPEGFWGAGLLSCAAILSKPAAAPEILMFAVFLLFFVRWSSLQRFSAFMWLVFGYLVGIALLLVSLKAGGMLNPWWSQSVISRIHYVNQVGWAAYFRHLALQPLSFGLVYLWAWILIWSGRRGADANRTAYQLILIWLAASFLGVLMGRKFYANYYIQVFPAVSLLAAIGLDRLRQEGRLKRSRILLIVGSIAFLVPFLWFQARAFAHCYFFFDAPAHKQVTLWDMCVIDRNLQAITRDILSTTRPGDQIFVWGPNPEFYFLSGRPMATAFPSFDVTDPAEPPYEDDEQRTLEALLKRPPALIIDSIRNIRLADRAGWGELITRHYRLYREENGVRLFLRVGAP